VVTRSIPLVAVAVTLSACGGDDAGPGAPTGIEVETRHERGADVAAANGCLGCHRIAEQGNAGPGPDLTRIGARMSRAEIADYLVNPQAPMPSYSQLKQSQPADFAELTAFLAELK
jgi:mono/diheme cytochrome c family protein